MKAKLINSLDCVLEEIISADEPSGKRSIIKNWIPLMQPGDKIIYCEEHED